MKGLKVLVVTLFLSFIPSRITVCDAQYIEILKGLGTAVKIVRETLMPLVEHHNKTVDDHVIQNEKLDNITMNIKSIEEKMMASFKHILKEIDKIPGETVSQHTASEFEKNLQSIGKILGKLALKKEKVNKGELAFDDHFKHDVNDYKTDLEKYRHELEVIIQGKKMSVDFLAYVKQKADVCTNRMTQLQLLDSFRALYVDTVSRYLLARHIVISLWESADNKSHVDKKKELNSNVRRDMVTYTQRFQELMSQASREFQLCEKPSSEYALHSTAKKSQRCYMVGEGKLSNQIVSFEPHFGSRKPCWDYVSLRPVKPRPGYVVVGVAIAHNVNVLYIRIVEGKLMPNGIIDPKSITHNADPAPGIGDQVIKLDYRQTIMDITETIAPDGHVITGLRFAQSDDKHIYLELTSAKLDLGRGVLLENTKRTEPHAKGLTEYKVRSFDERNNDVTRNQLGLQPVKPNQYLKFVPGGKMLIYPFIDLDDVYPTPLTLLSGVSLYVQEVKGSQGYLSIRLHNFNIVPHVTEIVFDVNEDFSKVLASI